jgi:hypothetical protein
VGASSVCTEPKAMTILGMAESNYPDNYGYLHCPTVVFCNQKLYRQV